MERDEWVLEIGGEELVYRVAYGSPEHDRLVGWLERTGIDHERVPVPGRATIRDGKLTVELFAVDDDGHHYVDPADDTRAARTTRTVPLVTDPPECWMRREAGAGGTA